MARCKKGEDILTYAIVEIEQTHAENATTLSLPPINGSSTETLPRLDIIALRQRKAKLSQLLQTWLKDTSGYEEETWAALKQNLNRNRSAGQRLLYHD